MSRQRVVVTGLGVVTSIGIGKDSFWQALIKGTSGIKEIKSFDTSDLRCHRGGEITDFYPEQFISRHRLRFLGRTSQLAIASAYLALKDSGLLKSGFPADKTGIMVGTTVGERPLEELITSWARGGLKEVNREKIFQASVNNICANVGLYFKITGTNILIPTACSAGNYALGYGYDLIKNRDLTFALVGGAEAFSRVAFVGFQRLYAMSPDKCQPFDKNRKGMMLGEGSAILVLESLDSALKRRAHIYAEVLGYGLSCDATHPTAPDVDGVSKVMINALKESRISPDEVDYICAHGTGTSMNDKTECAAIKRVFGDNTKRIKVSSIKSMLGHTMGAASAIESVACCLAIDTKVVPPTINYQTFDPDCDIDCVPNEAQELDINVVINNGFAFGGNNCSVVFRRFSQ